MDRLTDFVRNNMDPIIAEWETFARSLPPGCKMTRETLRDHIRGILNFIAKDIATSQSESQQTKKSQGDVKSTSVADTSAEIHGVLRLESGFDIMEMVSEYRALRASVTKLWTRALGQISETELLDLIRFNEAIDQALAESVLSFTKNLDASKDLFLGILGHDVRNPLGAISMSAELLKIKGPLNEQQNVLMTQIKRGASRINEMVGVLLDLARARLGSGIPIQKQAMNFGSVAQTIVEEMRVLHPTRKFVLEVLGNVPGQGDPARINQVLSNLLGNAVQYGLKEGTITVSAAAGAQWIELSVHNRGKPIPVAAIPTIFDSLVRGQGSDKNESTNLGLGLYIAKIIVGAHGGDLSVVSTETEGTTFTARFPH